jgi:hypothetical protein
MEFTLEGYVIAVLGILPGFLASGIQNFLVPQAGRSKIGEWVATSILTSLWLNVIVSIFFLTIFSDSVSLSSNIIRFVQDLRDQPVTRFLWYGGWIYSAASVWGLVSSLLASRLVSLPHRWRLTPISPVPNVFTDELDSRFRTKENLRLRDRPEQDVPWIRINRVELTVIGRLRRSNVEFDIEKPFEVFLSPAYVIDKDARKTIASPDGIHLRVSPTDIVEIHSARADWVPPADS